MCSLKTNCAHRLANPAAEKKAVVQKRRDGPLLPERTSSMDGDNKLQFPTLPATKEELLVSVCGSPFVSMLPPPGLIWATLRLIVRLLVATVVFAWWLRPIYEDGEPVVTSTDEFVAL